MLSLLALTALGVSLVNACANSTATNATDLPVSQLVAQLNQSAALLGTSDPWIVLDQVLGTGRLQTGIPVSAPCFASFDGSNATANSTACAEVIAGYTDPTFRSPRFGAYMLVSIHF